MNRDEIICQLRAYGLHVTEWWEVGILLDTLDQARSMVDGRPPTPPAAGPPPERCGTCGSDDPGWQKPPCTQVDEPDAFHSLPPAGKEARDGE